MYTQTNVGLLCCVGSGSNVAVPKTFISAPKFPDRFWGPPSVLGEVAGLMLPPGGGLSGWYVRLSTIIQYQGLEYVELYLYSFVCVMTCT